MIFKTGFKVKTTFVAIFIAIATMACLSCANDIEYVYEESISLMAMPDKTEYVVGDTLDLTGLAVTSIGKDGKPVLLPDSAFTVTPPHGTPLDEAGTQTVTVSYLDKEVSFPVTVFGSYLAFSEQPQDKEIALYAENETLSAKIILIDDGEVSFVWYRKNAGEADFSEVARTEPERVASLQVKETVLVLPKNNYLSAEYYCVATLTASGNMVQAARSNTARVTQRVETGLPVVRIDTENGAGILDKVTEVPMSMKILNKDYSESNYEATIRIRGNATAGYPKKPYKIKLSKKSEILGMPENKSWVLLANYCDKTLMRTAIGFKVSELLKLSWTPKSEFVELIINDEYLGNYELTESVKEGKNRVNIEDSVKKGNYGYLIEKDGYYAQEPVWFVTSGYNYGYSFKFPDNEDITAEIKEYIESYINDFEQVLKSEDSIAFDEENGYQKYIDLDSWCRWFLVQNIIANLDSNYFMYKKDTTTSKLYMGPVWDFEWSIGIGWYSGSRPNPNHNWIKPIYFGRLMEDFNFTAKLTEIWKSELIGLETELLGYIEELREKLSKSQKVNFARWNIMDSVVSVGGIPMGSYDAEVDCDKTFLSEHIKWLDTAINGL